MENTCDDEECKGLSSLSSRRCNVKVNSHLREVSQSLAGCHSFLEVDSHADTCVVGQGALVIHDYHRPVEVGAYDKQLGTRSYRTVSAVLAYDCPRTGNTFMLVIHQAIEIPHLDHHLLCPMQCRVHGITINDLPKFLCQDPSLKDHAVIAPGDDVGADPIMIAPLSLRGVTSILDVYKPSMQEWTSGEGIRVDLTDRDLD